MATAAARAAEAQVAAVEAASAEAASGGLVFPEDLVAVSVASAVAGAVRAF